jgi:hypothetical protein
MGRSPTLPGPTISGVDENKVQAALAPYGEDTVPLPARINDENDYVAAAELLLDVTKRKKELEELRKNITRPLDDSKKKVMDLFRPAVVRMEGAEVALKGAIRQYQIEQEQKRADQEMLLRREYDQKVKEVVEESNKFFEQGQISQANEALATIPPVPVVIASPKASAPVSTRKTWKAIAPRTPDELINFLLYVANTGMWNLIEVNQQALNDLARASRGTVKVPGVTFYEETTVVSK